MKKRPIDVALSMMRNNPSLKMRQVREAMINAGHNPPSLSMLYRWRNLAGLNPKTTALTGVLYPPDLPGYLIETNTGTRVLRAPFKLSDGRRIFKIENFDRGNARTVQPNLAAFLAWLESFEGKPITLFTLIDGELSIIPNE